MKANNTIFVVAQGTELEWGGKTYGVPPKESRGRAKAYCIAMPLQAAATLHRQKRICPAFEGDANALRAFGTPCRPHWPKKGSPHAPAEDGEGEGGELKAQVSAALESGLKADLEAAIAATGLDATELTSNPKRKAALEAWLGEQE